MTISEVIAMGKSAAAVSGYRGYEEQNVLYYCGESYARWLALATRYLESTFPTDTDITEFRRIAFDGDEVPVEKHNRLIAILESLVQYPPAAPKHSSESIIKLICTKINKFDTQIKRRHGDRPTLVMCDEYDLQDAIHAILRIFFDDVRAEDYIPSYAGGNSRVDFFLPNESLILETKYTRANLRDKEVGEELIIDIARYKSSGKGNHLICLVYDKNSHIVNPAALKRDIEQQSDSQFRVSVFISPE